VTPAPPAATWVLHAGTRRVPAAAAPDLRGRSFRIRAEVETPPGGASGVLFSQGDGCSGQALFVAERRLVHVYRYAGDARTTSSSVLDAGAGPRVLELVVDRDADGARVTLLVDNGPVGQGVIDRLARTRIAYTGVDVGRDRGQPVGPYDAPFAFTGTIRRLVVVAAADQLLDLEAERRIEAATG